MEELHWRILITVIVGATVAIRLLIDHLYPQIIRGSREHRRRIRVMLASLPVSLPILLQLAGVEILPMNFETVANVLVRSAGVALALMAGIGIMWPRLMQSRRDVWSPPITSPTNIPAHQLITTGPYRYVRHPFYGACILGIVAIELTLASYLVFILLAVALVGFRVVALREEQNLVTAYGDAYRSYSKHTWRFLPFIY